MTFLPETQNGLREQAIRRLRKRRDFWGHLLVYLMVNTFLAVVWWMTGANGFFWPVIPMALWGIGVVMNGWDVYGANELDETSIRREMDHLRRSA